MHTWTLLITFLASTAFASPLEPRYSYPWISWFDNADMDCSGSQSANAPWLKLKNSKCHAFAPTTNNVGWSWGDGLDFQISEIRFFKDAKCVEGLLHADLKNDTNQNGYCLTTNEFSKDYPQWQANNPPILSVMASSQPSDK